MAISGAANTSNRTSDSAAARYVAAPLTVTITVPAPGDTVDATPSIAGTVSPCCNVTSVNVTITAPGLAVPITGTAFVAADCSFAFDPQVSLAPGTYTATVTATNAAGQVGNATVSFTVQNTLKLDETYPTNGQTIDVNQQFVNISTTATSVTIQIFDTANEALVFTANPRVDNGGIINGDIHQIIPAGTLQVGHTYRKLAIGTDPTGRRMREEAIFSVAANAATLNIASVCTSPADALTLALRQKYAI